MPGPEQAHFLDELYDIADRYPAFRVIPIRKRSLGHLTVSDLEAVNPNVSHGHVFICGPPVMIDNLTTGLAMRGVPPHRIHSEASISAEVNIAGSPRVPHTMPSEAGA